MSDFKTALLASPVPLAREAEAALRKSHDFVDRMEDADRIIVLGGDGFMLQTLHKMLAENVIKPVFGMNRGTVGFLMNGWHDVDLEQRLNKARKIKVCPLIMEAKTADGKIVRHPAINEISLLRETRQTAKIKVHINDREVIEELVCDGVLVATPVGSTAYNLSANGPILPLDSNMLALTPISPFRPRRWKGAILPNNTRVRFTIIEARKRPVSAVADQQEIRDIQEVTIAIDPTRQLEMMFDPEHALDERISMEQFVT